MHYISTRGEAEVLNFEDTMLRGLAADGGLYVPERYPHLSRDTIADMAGRPYAEVAYTVLQPFVGDAFGETELRDMIGAAYATFSHDAIAPLVQVGPGEWVMELFHGPTLAFKDVAMQLLARMMDAALQRRGQRATIIGATSGDTGGAAIDAFQGREAIDIFILHPHGRVSDVQRRQMTTVAADNVHNIALEGTFDDCQAIVKAMFADLPTRDRLALSGVNSINWARIMAQTVYYFTTATELGAPARPVSYSVPTGNFGDVLAGWVAKRMGLPIDRLVIASNRNDILPRALATGRYEVGGVVATQTPSMDIQVSSNFERLLFEASGRDADLIRRMMGSLKQSGAFTMPHAVREAIVGEFDAGRADVEQTDATMAEIHKATGEVLDPHTAVGVHVARAVEAARRGAAMTDAASVGIVAHPPVNPGENAAHKATSRAPMVTLATAHPAKFPAAVEAATGVAPALPARVGDLHARAEHFDVIANDYGAVRDFLFERSRACNMGG